MTTSKNARGEARPQGGLPRPPPPKEPWVSRKHWRRALAISIEAGLTKAERRELMARLARVRGGSQPQSASPRLRLVQGGGGGVAVQQLPGVGAGPSTRDAA